MPTSKIVILGHSGCGKSFLGRVIQAVYPRRIVFDTMHEYDETNSPGAIFCETFEGFAQEFLGIKERREKRFTLIVRFDIERENRTEELNQCLKIIFKHSPGVLVVIEEVQTFCGTHSMPLWLENCLMLGRHHHISLLFTTQRPGLCHKSIISQANHLFCGQIHEKNDVDYVRALLGDRAEELRTIPYRLFLYWEPGKPIRRVRNTLASSGEGPENETLGP